MEESTDQIGYEQGTDVCPVCNEFCDGRHRRYPDKAERWFLVAMDINLLAQPKLAGLYGPFISKEKALEYQPRVEENGTSIELVMATEPSLYPWADDEMAIE